MNFRREQIKEYYLLDTEVENIFINEYMAAAPGDFVKVYLFALMYADLHEHMDNEVIARQLGLAEEDVLRAWTYWEDMGVIRKHSKEGGDKFHYEVEFLSLKGRLYSKENRKKQAQKPLDEQARLMLSDNNIQSMYKSIERIIGRVISGTEMMEILSWINDFHASPEIVVYAYSYCKSREKKNIRYVAAVVKRWVSEGLNDVLAVEEYLKNTDQRHYLYRRVHKALGFNRNATEEEMKIMDTWFDDMGYTIDKVLEACGKTSGISNPNINYVNKILVNWYREKNQTGQKSASSGVSAAVVQRYYNYLRDRAEKEAEDHRQEVYGKVPALRAVEEELNACRMDMSKVFLSRRADKQSAARELQKRVDELNGRRAVLLTDNNFELDYMDVHYQCEICKDTGTNDEGGRCACYNLRTKEAELWQIENSKKQ